MSINYSIPYKEFVRLVKAYDIKYTDLIKKEDDKSTYFSTFDGISVRVNLKCKFSYFNKNKAPIYVVSKPIQVNDVFIDHIDENDRAEGYFNPDRSFFVELFLRSKRDITSYDANIIHQHTIKETIVTKGNI